eukprot:Rhum_TRINITY_DN7659_c0_g1::Rhum_TRINITY_DN7659_c0_g1_i1::g.24118::m.24118
MHAVQAHLSTEAGVHRPVHILLTVFLTERLFHHRLGKMANVHGRNRVVQPKVLHPLPHRVRQLPHVDALCPLLPVEVCLELHQLREEALVGVRHRPRPLHAQVRVLQEHLLGVHQVGDRHARHAGDTCAAVHEHLAPALPRLLDVLEGAVEGVGYARLRRVADLDLLPAEVPPDVLRQPLPGQAEDVRDAELIQHLLLLGERHVSEVVEVVEHARARRPVDELVVLDGDPDVGPREARGGIRLAGATLHDGLSQKRLAGCGRGVGGELAAVVGGCRVLLLFFFFVHLCCRAVLLLLPCFCSFLLLVVRLTNSPSERARVCVCVLCGDRV